MQQKGEAWKSVASPLHIILRKKFTIYTNTNNSILIPTFPDFRQFFSVWRALCSSSCLPLAMPYLYSSLFSNSHKEAIIKGLFSFKLPILICSPRSTHSSNVGHIINTNLIRVVKFNHVSTNLINANSLMYFLKGYLVFLPSEDVAIHSGIQYFTLLKFDIIFYFSYLWCFEYLMVHFW